MKKEAHGDHHHQQQRIHDPRGRKAQRDPDGPARRGRHPLLLLAPRALGGRQLPDVRDRGRQQGPQDRRDQAASQAGPRLPDAGQGWDRAGDRQPQGQGTPANDHGVPALEPSPRLPGLRPGRRVRPAGLQFPLRPVGPSLRRGTDGQPAQGRLRPDPAQHGPVHHVHPMRAVHPRDFPDRRARGDAPGKSRRDRHLSGPSRRQPAGRQRGRPLPGRRLARQRFPAQAARLVPVQARLDLHALLDRVQYQRRGKPRGPLAVQAPPQSARQRLLDLRRRTVQLQGGQRPQLAGGDVRPQERRSPAGRDRRGREGRRPGLEGDRRSRRD